MDFGIDKMTLQEKVKNTERLLRELIEHLERGFVPKLHALHKLAKVSRDMNQLEEIGDLTIRTHVAQVLESEKFTDSLYEKLAAFAEALEQDMKKVLYEGT